ncbi:MAG: LlaJI family restriction endonuclease [Ruminococcaceae bacterium]|nr:LlaJI family restriction endonuclease [Oscillospiraceae bacterium]
MLLSNNRPFYPELQTRKRVVNDYDYFKRLHECVLSLATKELRSSDLMDLFDIMPVELSDEELGDFGEREYILYRIERELNVQFNTRKQLVLKTLYSYVSHGAGLYDVDAFSMFGTSSFNLVWERVCSEVMDNQLSVRLALRSDCAREHPCGILQPLVPDAGRVKVNGAKRKLHDRAGL